MATPQIQLKALKSSLDGVKLFELINKTKLNKLINSAHLNTQKWLTFDNEKDQLERFISMGVDCEFNGNKTDFCMISVKYDRKSEFGRVFPIKSLSLGSLRRELRHTIASGVYVDIDVANAHPVIIFQTCQANEIECPILGQYITNREDILADTMKAYKVSRDVAKNLFISLLYFGSFASWVKREQLNAKYKPTKFINDLIAERAIYADFIQKNNDDLVIDVHTSKAKKGLLEFYEEASVVSTWCQEVEQRILECIYKHAVSKKYIKKKEAVLCFDGIMLMASNYKPEILAEFNAVVKATFGYDLSFVLKEFDQAIDIDSGIETQSDSDEAPESDEEPEQVAQPVNNRHDDRAFFKALELISHSTVASIFYDRHPNKYVYSNISGWYSYNKYNILENTGKDSHPHRFFTNITSTLTNYLMPIRNRMKPNDPSYIKDNKNINKLIKDVGNHSYVKGVAKYLEELYTSMDIDEKIDENPNLLAFNNMVFDKTIMEFRDILPSDYIIKTTKYLMAESNKKISKDIKEIIHSIFEDEELENYFLNIKAQSLFGNTSESCFVQVGRGGNGKGIVSMLEKVALGNYISTTENTFLTSSVAQGSANPTLAGSKGIRNLVVSEPADTDMFGRETSLNTAFLKLITGNDDIKARQLYNGNIAFLPQFTPFIQCNTLPNIKKVDDGIVRRIKVITFPFSFVENPTEVFHRKIDRNLKGKINCEEYGREYILLLLETLKKNINIEIPIPKVIQEATSNYFADHNPIAEFIKTCIRRVDPNLKRRIKASELKTHFDSVIENKIHIKEFIRVMGVNGFQTYMLNGCKAFKDIEIIENEEDNY